MRVRRCRRSRQELAGLASCLRLWKSGCCLISCLDPHSGRFSSAGAILLHGKRSYAELTLDALQHGQRRHLRLRRFDGDWRADDASSLSRRPRRPTVVVVDRPSRREEVVRLLEQRTAADQPSYGTWVLGFIGEFALSQVGLFDAIIMFDTSEDQLSASAPLLSFRDQIAQHWQVQIKR